uniref:Uncharacterized protein n=1 Tax=Anguilla anguilla TaxID=7936 RepID=A0A0E9XK16_ANGAN
MLTMLAIAGHLQGTNKTFSGCIAHHIERNVHLLWVNYHFKRLFLSRLTCGLCKSASPPAFSNDCFLLHVVIEVFIGQIRGIAPLANERHVVCFGVNTGIAVSYLLCLDLAHAVPSIKER